jgi:tetratricopeptide (TPR) repeat protein
LAVSSLEAGIGASGGWAAGSFEDEAARLTGAAAAGDRDTAWQAAARIVPHLASLERPINAAAVRHLVWAGAGVNRWFDIAELLASAAAMRADATPEVRRLQAQMLMERGFADEALARLARLLADPALSPQERSEAAGHVGRIHKDRFLASAAAGDGKAARAFLKKALDAYLGFYEADPASFWHGINAVGLLARPEARSARKDAAEASRRIAASILEEVPRQDPALASQYSKATLVEAHVALGNYGQALELLRQHVANPKVNAFSLANLLRQFVQLWRLDQRQQPAPQLLVLLREALLRKEGGVLHLSGNDVRRERRAASSPVYEAVFGGDRFDSLENYRRGLDRAAGVARIGRSLETGAGTGFVLPGKLLSPKLGEGYVLLTNAHVVSEEERERQRGALHPSEAVVTFAAMEMVAADKPFELPKLLFYSPPDQLDVAVAELNPSVSPPAYPVAAVLPVRGSGAQVRVIGHPSGRGLSFSVNELLDHQAPKIHYRTATEGGSSGSPVFNQEWKLIGLHHAGGDSMPRLNGQDGTYQANEGIWIRAIAEAIEKCGR